MGDTAHPNHPNKRTKCPRERRVPLPYLENVFVKPCTSAASRPLTVCTLPIIHTHSPPCTQMPHSSICYPLMAVSLVLTMSTHDSFHLPSPTFHILLDSPPRTTQSYTPQRADP